MCTASQICKHTNQEHSSLCFVIKIFMQLVVATKINLRMHSTQKFVIQRFCIIISRSTVYLQECTHIHTLCHSIPHCTIVCIFIAIHLPFLWRYLYCCIWRYNVHVHLLLVLNHCEYALFPIAVLIIFCGLFINGPYALITTAVSNDLVRKCTCTNV